MLIAEDHTDSRDMLRSALESAGYAVSAVSDGAELYVVLTTSAAGHFALVVVDEALPSMHGLEAMARASAGIPFIVVTAATDPNLEHAATRLGAAAFVQKPIDLPPFLRLVRRIVFG